MALMRTEFNNDAPLCRIECSKGVFYMEIYEITYNGTVVGCAQMAVEGLYYRIQCELQTLQEKMYRIYLLCDNTSLDLGTCIKDGCRYRVNTKIPCSKISGRPRFQLFCPESDADHFMEIMEGVPFLHIEKLPDSKLSVREGRIGIIVQA